ncbi:MAG TPA: ATP-grasp domain-containing protein [Streptosporangiaceae bacterium]|nr:ATP-grasp domain-containing protein [Streptosporangiaceae bacterium]
MDDYAHTRRLAPYFREAGYSCIRVQSTAEVPAVFLPNFSLDGYVVNIVHTGSVEKTLRELARHRPVAVVAGSEIGVELADALSEGLGLATNGTALSAARRDKGTMIDTITAAGLPAAAQLRVSSEDGLRSWHERIGGRIVVKPVRSAGSKGVYFCDSADEAVTAYRTLLGETDLFGQPNESIVAQEYLPGTEYVVNTVSRAGRHHVCDMWRTVRADVNGVLDKLAAFYVIPREGAVQDQLVSYGCQVLDAIGIQYGPAHIEIKITPDGHRLVEIAARMSGMDNPYYAELSLGESQLNWTVDAYVNPGRFDRHYQDGYQIHQFFASVCMLSPYSGTLRSYPYLSEVKRLESLHELQMAVKPGDPIIRSVNDATHPLIVNLRHPVEEVVVRDMQTLRYFDGYAFYDVE